MADDLCGIDTTYLLMHVEIAHTLGARFPQISRGEEHRLLDSIRAIAEATGEAPHDLWVQYAGTGQCSPGCDHKETA